jgi:hypothetical protein
VEDTERQGLCEQSIFQSVKIIFEQKLLIFQDNSPVMYPEIISERYKASSCQEFRVLFSPEVKPPNVIEASENARDLHFERLL